MTYEEMLERMPAPEPFVPYATIFKLGLPGETARKTVQCLACQGTYPLQDLLEGELNDDQCPTCKMWSVQYWKGKPHKKVPQ